MEEEEKDGLAMSRVEWLKPPTPEDTASYPALQTNATPEAMASAVAFFLLATGHVMSPLASRPC